MKNTPTKPDNKKKSNKRPGWQFGQQLVATIVMILIFTGIYSLVAEPAKERTEVTLSEIVDQINAGQVSSIVVRGEKLEIALIDESLLKAKKERESGLTETLANYGVDPVALTAVDFEIKNETGIGYWISQTAPVLFPVLFIAILLWFIYGQIKGTGMKAFSFGQSKARIIDPNDANVTFKDVSGADEAKLELEEVVDFLKNPKKFLDIGAKIPKGVLLMGPPGTGKTLLARAVAGEAKVPFFHLSGSEFVEMFVGVGASRVRDLFEMAKKASPAIIFIDEIDAVGRSRGVGIGGGNDEREQTLNQILVEMDGFEPHQKLIVIAATNRPDVLDDALLRPGRFDRRVFLDLPDRKGREGILDIHTRNKRMVEAVNLKEVATRTPGFSGADLANLMNEAAILAARRSKTEIEQIDILESIEKVMIGPERRSHLHTEKERKVTAYHEAGHAIIASVLPNADPVHKVSIVARGRAGGYTMKLPLEDRKLQTKAEFMDDIAMSLGGFVAERMIMGDTTTGPSNDLQVSTHLARNMVTRWGMSDEFGPIALISSNGKAMFGSGSDRSHHSEAVEQRIDAAVHKIMQDSLVVAEKVLTDHKDAFEAVAEELLKKENLEREEYNTIIKKFGIIPKELKDDKEGIVIAEQV